MGIFKYLCKVLQNENGVYDYENLTLRDAGSSLLVSIVCIGLLVFQPLRIFLKWLAYFSVGVCAFFMLCLFVSSLNKIRQQFRYAKKLEKLGTSVEEEEMARRKLCEAEGDDGLPSEKEVNVYGKQKNF